jgi:hypothetical protein
MPKLNWGKMAPDTHAWPKPPRKICRGGANFAHPVHGTALSHPGWRDRRERQAERGVIYYFRAERSLSDIVDIFINNEAKFGEISKKYSVY